MHTWKSWFKSLLLAVLSGLLTIGIHSPAFSGVTLEVTQSPVKEEIAQVATNDALKAEATANLQTAKSVLMAQGMPNRGLKTYVAMMSKANVVPTSPQTQALGTVGAVLSGDRLIVRGSFRNLSSPLRDYATDPVNPPNPNITSAFHIHRGMPSENGPFQYALTVMLDDTGRAGTAMGEYTLTAEQLTALENNMLYVDLHTTRNRAGELRAVLMPYE
ncbi:CHRD domain-containing protein [Oscillatoria sp. FACHB-1407]|uniref:CHRD domain-containing protein n=1 Tax=Oscillatoria sp. FACHB-1407 TaxID=2692847 RepID=UPI00168929CF|nr:CHRD domain-containing protein [Oscillatoria sp. FACHB-1407]MBD2465022.1 CHRD domain-containing protein [Oscillatoria sp. FACHB-1407]